MQELCNYTNYPASENVKCYHSADQRQDVLEKKNLKHLALHDDHAASNLLTFGRLFYKDLYVIFIFMQLFLGKLIVYLSAGKVLILKH